MTRFGQFAVAAVIAVGLAALPAGAAAKGQKKGGGAHSMTGCLQKGDEANTYKLTSVEGNGPKTVEIVGMASGVDLAPHVGHKVTITGHSVGARAAAKTEGKKEGTKDEKKGMKNDKEERGEHHMRVDAVKMVSATCP
jgi:hypothetical protein